MIRATRRRTYRTRRLLVQALYANHLDQERKTDMSEITVTTGSQTLDKEELRLLVADILDLDPAEVTDEAHFVDDLDVDSLMALEIAVRLEREYEVKLAEPELASVTSLQSTHALLQDKLQEKA
ncbi:phosphopantetheine-binding protein [Streptomyces sp. ISL-96]|uniref:acyl carrier protein n=1 Tax=Streptomyces sp. ISL-96 TaxID=2819191 RepID=UPI0027E269B7|nr:phosphopantetheine-binding protein [Streptomyces sp. ISL-96]